MGAMMYLVLLLPVALCQSVTERIETLQNELNATRGQVTEKEKELQGTKNELRVCREQEIDETQTTIENMGELTTYGPTNEPPEVTVDYSTLHQYNYQAVNSVQVEGFAQRLTAQDEELWCTTWSTLHVYSQDLELLRSVPLEGVLEAEAVTPLPSGQLVVADWAGGLHVLHPNGSWIQSLRSGGRFDDVVSVQGGVHALRDSPAQWNRSIVYSYRIISGELQAPGTITLPHNAQRMSVFNDTLYLTDSLNGRLYQYTTLGQLLGLHGQEGEDMRGTSQPGLLNSPDMCSNDRKGNVLVADKGNYRLQVWSPRDGWTVIPLARDSQLPIDAVVSGDGSTMWVVELNSIVKYTKQ